MLLTPFKLAIFSLDYLHKLLDAAGRFSKSIDYEEMSVDEAYGVLEVAPEACLEVIKAAYRALALKHHPDCGGSEQAMKRLNAAYSRLMKAEAPEKFAM